MQYRMALDLVRGRARERRERIGASQAQAADAIGISPTHVGHLENGGAVAPKVIVASSVWLTAIETGLGLYGSDGVKVDVDRLRVWVRDLEQQLEVIQADLDALEVDHAETAATLATAATVFGNGHVDRPVPLTAA